jgi:hypothetical protein
LGAEYYCGGLLLSAKGRIDAFRIGCRENKEKTYEVLRFLADNENWHRGIWQAALIGLEDDKVWEDIAPLIVKASPELYTEEAWAIASWTKKAVSTIERDSQYEQYFWSIFDLLIEHALDDKRPDHDGEVINYAINHPVGIITEALIDRFGKTELSVAEGIPEGPLLDSIGLILDNNSLIAGKIILASRLHYFYAVDPNWTEENLIPLFRWEDSEDVAFMWQGYLWSPRISIDLAVSIKEQMLNAVKNADQLADTSERLLELFTSICLEYPNIYSSEEQRNVLTTRGKEGLEHVAQFLWQSVSGDLESADIYWQSRIYPYYETGMAKVY